MGPVNVKETLPSTTVGVPSPMSAPPVKGTPAVVKSEMGPGEVVLSEAVIPPKRKRGRPRKGT